jgi:hypothetical protein
MFLVDFTLQFYLHVVIIHDAKTFFFAFVTEECISYLCDKEDYIPEHFREVSVVDSNSFSDDEYFLAS